MSGQIRISKYYEWVFWFYDGTVMTHYIPDHPDPLIFERQITEAEDYHHSTSKVKRVGWVAISHEKATHVNMKARYIEAIPSGLLKNQPLIVETHGEWPLIKRPFDIRYYGPRAGEHEYYYLAGVGGKRIEHEVDGKILVEFVNGRYSIMDRFGAIRSDHTSFVIPPIPPEAADGMSQIIEEIAKFTGERDGC